MEGKYRKFVFRNYFNLILFSLWAINYMYVPNCICISTALMYINGFVFVKFACQIGNKINIKDPSFFALVRLYGTQ